MCCKPEDIQQSFEDDYKDLYGQPGTADTSKIDQFLKSLDLPFIGDEQNNIALRYNHCCAGYSDFTTES